jgi:hypothetical protein
VQEAAQMPPMLQAEDEDDVTSLAALRLKNPGR